jgi:AmiR/NasT family two-component response regulator
MLMARSEVSEQVAFRMLVQASQRENVRLREICSRIISAHEAQIERRDELPH